MNKILVTGGAGFIGSHLVLQLIETFPDAEIHNLDKLTYAADLQNLEAITTSRYSFIEGDIVDFPFLKNLIETNRYDAVFHLAAESHVDNSISSPDIFIRTNINGTFNLLECFRSLWMVKPFEKKPEFANARFVHVSTDEVYGSLGPEGFFTEETPIQPNSPYSASKASSDLIVRSYFKTYGLPVVKTNCSNNFGPHQHKEKLIPTVIRTALSGDPIPVYGNGKNVRDWLFVKDHCQALELCLRKGQVGETYNIGGDNEVANIDLVKRICERLDILKPAAASYANQISFVTDRPGHDWRYSVCIDKISELGWKPSSNFDENLDLTIAWYLKKLGVY